MKDHNNPEDVQELLRKPDAVEVGALVWFTYAMTVYGFAAAGCLCIGFH